MQPCCTGEERTRAHRQDDRAGIGGLSHRLERLRQVSELATDRRDCDQISADQVVETVIRGDGGADGCLNRLAWLGSADLEIEVGDTVRGAVDAEDLADHAELKNR
jgi:hypothetical protein